MEYDFSNSDTIIANKWCEGKELALIITHTYSLKLFLVNIGHCKSNSEAFRLINAGGVKINYKTATVKQEILPTDIIRIGQHQVIEYLGKWKKGIIVNNIWYYVSNFKEVKRSLFERMFPKRYHFKKIYKLILDKSIQV